MRYKTIRYSGAAFLEWWGRQEREAETSEINLKAENMDQFPEEVRTTNTEEHMKKKIDG